MAETLAQRVRKARLRCDLTQKALADRAHLSRTSMNQIETGDTLNPRMTHLKAIAEALGVSMDYLAGRVPDEYGHWH